MDQTLQARLIGATVLVALAVLLIPELLSGRKTVEPAAVDAATNPGTRTFTIELGGPGGQEAALPSASPAPIAPAKRAQAPPEPDLASPEAPSIGAAQADPSVDPERTMPTVAPPPVADEAPAEATPRQPPPSTTGPVSAGDWVVQVGAFGSAEAARRLVEELASAGYTAQVAPVSRAGRTLHRVRVGPASGRPAAEQLAARLKTRGLPAAVVEND